jgi:hypothetical protein
MSMHTHDGSLKVVGNVRVRQSPVRFLLLLVAAADQCGVQPLVGQTLDIDPQTRHSP